jgi:hypothetical protein
MAVSEFWVWEGVGFGFGFVGVDMICGLEVLVRRRQCGLGGVLYLYQGLKLLPERSSGSMLMQGGGGGEVVLCLPSPPPPAW